MPVLLVERAAGTDRSTGPPVECTCLMPAGRCGGRIRRPWCGPGPDRRRRSALAVSTAASRCRPRHRSLVHLRKGPTSSRGVSHTLLVRAGDLIVEVLLGRTVQAEVDPMRRTSMDGVSLVGSRSSREDAKTRNQVGDVGRAQRLLWQFPPAGCHPERWCPSFASFTGALPFTWNPVANPSTAHPAAPLRDDRTARPGSLWHRSSTGRTSCPRSRALRGLARWRTCSCVGRGSHDRPAGRPAKVHRARRRRTLVRPRPGYRSE